MARINSSLTVKLETYMDDVVQAAYDELNDLEACAGIRNNEDLAMKARENHYGHPTPKGGYAPPRIWVDAATKDLDIGQSLAALIKSRLVPARARRSYMEKVYDFQTRRGTEEVYVRKEVRTRPFGEAQGGAYKIMEEIAKKMADNQRDFINSWGVIPENAESTIKRKGAGKPPMVDTGKMVRGIKGWVQHSSITVRVGGNRDPKTGRFVK